MTRAVLDELLAARLDERGAGWLAERRAELAEGLAHGRFAMRLSEASRFAPRGPLAPSAAERAAARAALPGWDPERWTTLEALRVALVLARRDLEEASAAEALEEAFRYADEGEACALYRSLAHLPGGERFVWRAGEGCRSNMLSVFQAVACDTPYPARHFDAPAFEQMVIKALFVGAPLWRVAGVDQRLSPELARMALDLADERRSAGRPVPPELWMCLGTHAGERALAALERELAGGPAATLPGLRGAALGLLRAGRADRLREIAAAEGDPGRRRALESALEGPSDQRAFAAPDERSR